MTDQAPYFRMDRDGHQPYGSRPDVYARVEENIARVNGAIADLEERVANLEMPSQELMETELTGGNPWASVTFGLGIMAFFLAVIWLVTR